LGICYEWPWEGNKWKCKINFRGTKNEKVLNNLKTRVDSDSGWVPIERGSQPMGRGDYPIGSKIFYQHHFIFNLIRILIDYVVF
jgi:hypothetical protein